jgi:hypothetical protein
MEQARVLAALCRVRLVRLEIEISKEAAEQLEADEIRLENRKQMVEQTKQMEEDLREQRRHL